MILPPHYAILSTPFSISSESLRQPGPGRDHFEGAPESFSMRSTIVFLALVQHSIGYTDSKLNPFGLRSGVTLRVCGNYCGPGWCNGKYLPETECDDSMPVETWNSTTGPSCADLCCKQHDVCCGHEPPYKVCNTNIVDCLSKCNHLSGTCTFDGVPVPAGGEPTPAWITSGLLARTSSSAHLSAHVCMCQHPSAFRLSRC